MSGLQWAFDALDSLAKDDLHGQPDAETLDRTATLVAIGNRVAAELTRTVRHAEITQAAERDGLKSMRSWLIPCPAVAGGGRPGGAIGLGAGGVPRDGGGVRGR